MVGGKRMAVLAGCNYACWGSDELKGCINDVVSMKELLTSKFGFKECFIELLTDDNEKNLKKMPTGANIKRALRRMIQRARQGDLLFFHFSGHGTLLHDENHGAIIASDYNIITDMDFRQLVGTIPHEATFTILADSCYSGGLIYQQKEQIGPATFSQMPQTNTCKVKFIPIDRIHNRLQQITGLINSNMEHCMRQHFGDDNVSLSYLQKGFNFQGFNFHRTFENGILLSGCQHDEKAFDDGGSEPPHGKFSYAVMTVLKKCGGQISNRQLVLQTRILVGNFQHPCLYSNDKNADATFLLQG